MMRFSLLFLAVYFCCGIAEAKASENFLNMVRSRSAAQNSFADLSGSVTHLKRNQGGAQYYPVRFLIRFGSEKVQAKLFLNKSEKHYFEQRHNLRTSIINKSNVKDGGLLSKLGFRMGDLTMDFLNYPVASEAAAETYKTLKCRILILRSPENKPVKVWIASEYLFPMRAEFYDSFDKISGKPARTLEITGFEKVNDYYVATDIALYSQDFRSRIAFKNCTAVKSDAPEAVKAFENNSL